MASWVDVEKEVPEFAARVRRLFDAHKHKVLATLRKDGAPRVSGIEAQFTDGEIVMGMMGGSLKARDLRRDPRMALSSAGEDVPAVPSDWVGDAKISGRVVEVPDPARPGEPSNVFRIDATEVVHTYISPTAGLVVESWHEGRGLELRALG
ncbi:pyridoxamine 5'-phosphate oxidase family protein [Actinoplanes sp. NPDC049599]|uniref:pyridoxamine 5'-phosphate oxidase family protein n=1 Tax=Actinoplanes sp. NPDC049599 TaxID=3363903 RepID=UPI0037BA7CDA